MDNAKRQGPAVRELAPAVSSLLKLFKICSDLPVTLHTKYAGKVSLVC